MEPRGRRAQLQTHHAIQATDLAAAMNDAMKKVRIAPGDYAPELMAPQGPSTAGGVLAMQHLRLVPGQAGEPTLVVGHANHAEGKAELRTFDYVDAVYRQRFRRPLVLDRAAYDAFLALAEQLFVALHLKTTVVGPPADSQPTEGSRHRSSTAIAWVVVVVLAVVGAGAWMLVR